MLQVNYGGTGVRLRPVGPRRRKLQAELDSLYALPRPNRQQWARMRNLEGQLDRMASEEP